jgi:outer membrane immunogenic protein
MKRVVFASVSLLALVAAGAAGAADLPRRTEMPTKAPAYLAQAYNWTGPYLGINAGGGWGRSSFDGTPPTGDFNVSGALIGGTLGYNWQAGAIVYGLEGDLDWSSIRGSAPCGALSCETRNSWLGTVRGRLGYAAANGFMPYVTGGLAVGDVKASVTGLAGARQTRAGWTLGAGAEFALSGPWTAKLEYLYADLGKFDCGTSCGTVAPDNVKFRANILRAGLNYRF